MGNANSYVDCVSDSQDASCSILTSLGKGRDTARRVRAEVQDSSCRSSRRGVSRYARSLPDAVYGGHRRNMLRLYVDSGFRRNDEYELHAEQTQGAFVIEMHPPFAKGD